MFGQKLLFAVVAAATMNAGHAFGAEYGTAVEAKAMLDRATLALKANLAGAIEKFNHNDWPFRDRDLYVFCFNGQDGKFVAHEAFIGSDVRDLKDRNGRSFGAEMYENAREGQIVEVALLSPFPGSTAQVPKRAYVTRIGDHVCGVSAYLYNGPGQPTE